MSSLEDGSTSGHRFRQLNLRYLMTFDSKIIQSQLSTHFSQVESLLQAFGAFLMDRESRWAGLCSQLPAGTWQVVAPGNLAFGDSTCSNRRTLRSLRDISFHSFQVFVVVLFYCPTTLRFKMHRLCFCTVRIYIA